MQIWLLEYIDMFIGYNVTLNNVYIFWPEKAVIDLGVPNVEAYGNATGRFNIGNAQVNCYLFRPKNIQIVKNNIVVDERIYLS